MDFQPIIAIIVILLLVALIFGALRIMRKQADSPSQGGSADEHSVDEQQK